MAKLKKTGDGSANAQVSMGNIGERMRSARENKGLSLEEVYKIIKIHPKTLEALEKGQLETKLGETYAKAFLKNYSNFLGLDAANIAAEYSLKKRPAESREKEPQQKQCSYKKKKEIGPDERKFIGSIITLALFIAILATLIFGAVKIVQFAKNTFPRIRTRAISHKKAEPAKEFRGQAASETKTTAENIVLIPKQRALTLTLSTSNDVWLKVMVDGKIMFHKTLSKRSKETWKAEKEIRLSEIGKPEALSMNVNGKDIDFSKRPTRSILITHEGVDLEPK